MKMTAVTSLVEMETVRTKASGQRLEDEITPPPQAEEARLLTLDPLIAYIHGFPTNLPHKRQRNQCSCD